MRSICPRILAVALAIAASLCSSRAASAADSKLNYSVGVAKVDITPEHPVRLQGWGHRRNEFEGVDHPIYARAFAVRHGDGQPVVIISADSCIIAESITRAIHDRVARATGLPRERLVLCSTHCHTAPVLAGAPPTSSTIFGVPVPSDHLANIDRYTKTFITKSAQAAIAAIANAKPATLSWGVGEVPFATNRRVRTANGQITHAQVLKPDDPAHQNPPSGTGIRPVDHSLPVLIAKDAEGKVMAVYTTYAYHCVTFQPNRITADWAGYAADGIEKLFPEAVAIVTIGGGADQNPERMILDKVTADLSVAEGYGSQIASEVERLAKQPMSSVSGDIKAKLDFINLPLAPLPTREQWEERAKVDNPFGHHAQVQVAKLDRGEELLTAVPYPVQSFAFGDDLAMIFLGGELVVDYPIRLRRELDPARIWVHGYSNTIPGYICSERVLKEGGYEVASAIFFDLPTQYAAGLEDVVINAVKAQVSPTFSQGKQK